MKEQYLKIFAGVLVGLLLIYFVTKPRTKSVNIDELVQTIVFGVAQDDVNIIEVYKETSSESPVRLVFQKQEDQWRIATKFNCKAQNSRIDRLLGDILEMTGNVRSSDPKHFETYQIADEQGLHLLLKDETNKTLTNLIIGKRAEDYNSGFIRFAGQEKVFSVDKNLLSSLSVYGDIDTLSRFNDKSFVELQAVDQDKEEMKLVGMAIGNREMVIEKREKEVEVTNEDSTTTTKIEDEWVLLGGRDPVALNQTDVNSFLTDVCKIRAQEVVDQIGNSLADINKNANYGFSGSRSTRLLVFQEPEGPQLRVLFGKEYEEDKGYYMLVQYDGLVYKLSKANYDKIFKWFDDLPTKVASE